MICYFKGLFACATSRATINVPPDQCYERVVAQAFWVLHCLSQVSEYMCTIATLPLVTTSLILGLQEGPCDNTPFPLSHCYTSISILIPGEGEFPLSAGTGCFSAF